MPRSSIPEDKINLRLIMVSGKTKDYLFKPSDSAGDIAQYIFDNWPEGKTWFFLSNFVIISEMKSVSELQIKQMMKNIHK